MKFLKIGLRFWLTITSMLSFLMGWVMLAHAPKPNPAPLVSSNSLAPLPELNPFHNLDSDEESFENHSFFNMQPNVNSQFRPAFRTGGS
jgi:hypothetical protein